MINVFIKRLWAEAFFPTKKRPGDAGFDLYAAVETFVDVGKRKVIRTGISMAIPPGYVGLIWDRSGLAANDGIKTMAGVIDSNYRGEILVTLLNTNPQELMAPGFHVKQGDRIAQIIFQEVPKVELIEVASLDDTDRGADGHGSSGR